MLNAVIGDAGDDCSGEWTCECIGVWSHASACLWACIASIVGLLLSGSSVTLMSQHYACVCACSLLGTRKAMPPSLSSLYGEKAW